MPKKITRILGQQGLTLYDSLLKGRIQLNGFATNGQIDELFPLKVKPFETVTDEEFAAIINGYYDGTISLEQIQEVWHIGDKKEIFLENISNSGSTWTVGEHHPSQQVDIEIIDFIHDDLTTPINGKTKALLTLDLKSCLGYSIHSTAEYGNTYDEAGYIKSYGGSNGSGWSSCTRRDWCNDGFYNALPGYIKNLVKIVNKKSYSKLDDDILISLDKVFLLAEKEYGRSTFSKDGEGNVYTFYNNDSTNIRKMPPWTSEDEYCYYWTRSIPKDSYRDWIFMFKSGSGTISNPSSNLCLAPAFCL